MLSPIRFTESSVKKDDTDGRNPFQNDYARMILSSHIRRLQNKAQVFPLEKNDFVRNRLTHSLEVSYFAKGLGLGVEKYLLDKKILDEEKTGYIPAILEVAGLIHDIGNPPFGHFGEQIIQNYFRQLKGNTNIKKAFDNLTKVQQEDLKYFDGNVQGFRILRKLVVIPYNLTMLTMPTIATIIKYPYSSIEGNKKTNVICQKKFGYFDSEKYDYNIITDKLEIQNQQRYPLTYLLEAADDIAYSVSDIEDGYKLGIIDMKLIKDALNKEKCYKEFADLEGFENNLDVYIPKLRITAQSRMLVECTKTYNEKFNDVVSGKFNGELIKVSNAGKIRKAFERLSICNFSDKKVLKHELLGEEVISYFLNLFYKALFSNNLSNHKSKEYKIYSLISENYKKLACKEGEEYPSDNYKKFMLVTDFISGMTDTYALELYKELKGHYF
jgi:dGTPase